MKLAVVDVGSSSMRAFFAQISKIDERYRVDKEKIARCPVRLGWDVLQNGKISEPKQQILIEQLQGYADQLKTFNPDKFIALSTAAMRAASNASQVIDRLYSATGIQLQIIDGHTEGILLGCAVMFSNHDISCPVVCIDVGGGSTEIVVCDNQHIEHIESIPIGTMQLLADRKHDLRALRTVIEQLKVKGKLPKKYVTVGLGGNINTAKKFCGASKPSTIEVNNLLAFHDSLKNMTKQQRIENFGFSKHRSEVLPLALDIFSILLSELDSEQIIIPTLGLVDGAAICLHQPAIFNQVASPQAQRVWKNLIK